VRYNPQLGHLNIIALERPSEIKAEDVTVVMSSEIAETETAVTHSLRVRSATGCWQGLQGLPPSASGFVSGLTALRISTSVSRFLAVFAMARRPSR
jgi:hypothetical protein